MITLNNINLSSIDLSGIDLRGIKLGLGGRDGGSGDGFPVLPGDVTRWHFGGLTNEMMAAMDDPRLEDADGKGRFLSFKNFLWGKMSGVGGYQTDYNVWEFDSSKFTVKTTDHSFKITSISNTEVSIYRRYFFSASIPSYTIRVTGLTDGQTITYQLHTSEDEVMIDSDGIYVLPAFERQGYTFVRFYFGKIQESCDITIEQLPFYPGFILGDGVDDYAETEQELNFEDTYTVYTAFIPSEDDLKDNSKAFPVCGKDYTKDFYLRYSYPNKTRFYSANSTLDLILSNGFNLLTCKRTADKVLFKNLITGAYMEADANTLIENPGLYYLWRSATITNYSKAAIAGQTICNGHYSTDEEDTKVLDWYKKQYSWLFFDQAWTVVGKTNEDEDRATIANITGNGNDLVLSNFGFAEGSGYGLYAQNYISYAITNRAVYTKTNSSIHVTKSITAGVNFTESARDVTIPSYRIKVTGIQSGQEMIYRGSNNTFLTNIPSDGIYVLPAVENGSNLGFQFVSYTGDCDITIEQIPEYEGYLVTDGVDDSGRAVGLTISKDFTLVGEWILFSKTSVNAGLSIHPQIHIFNRPEAIQIMFRTAGKTLPVKSLKAICSDGRCYDENWSELKINVGEFTDNKGTLFVASNGTNYAQIAFKNLGIYDNHILSKDDCIKAYNYLQTLKAK